MIDATIPISSFLRFYEATPAHKVRLVQDSREYQYNPKGYIYRDYYRVLRHAMRRTHWKTGELCSFKIESGKFDINPAESSKIESFEQITSGYIQFVKDTVHSVFELQGTTAEFGNLRILINLDVGVETHTGERLALKVWYPAKGPTRLYRQGFEHLTKVLTSGNLSEGVKPAILDVRNAKILNSLRLPKDIDLSLRGQAAAFEAIWHELGR